MKISIIIPNHDKARYVAKTLESVKGQTFTEWEAIIVDDASSDDSVRVIEKFIEGDERFKLVKNETCRGGSASRNAGLANARGEYVMFLDSDDLLTRDCLKRRLAELEKDKSLACVVASMGLFKDGKFLNKNWQPGESDDFLKLFLSHKMPFSVMQPLWRKSFVVRLGGFDEKYPRLQDVEFHTRACLQKDFKIKVLQGGSDCFYRIDDDRSSSIDFGNMLKRKITGMCLFVQDMMKLIDSIESKSRRNQLVKALRKTVFSGTGDLLHQVRTGKISKSFAMELFTQLRDSALDARCIKSFSKVVLNAYFYGGKTSMARAKGYNCIFREVLSSL